MISALFIDFVVLFTYMDFKRRATHTPLTRHPQWSGEINMIRSASFHFAAFAIAFVVVAVAFMPLVHTAAAIVG
jgi:hypothetical protein